MTWNETLPLSEPRFLICEIGMISAMVTLRDKEDTLRAPGRELLLIVFFWPSNGPVVGVGHSVPRVIQCPGISPRQETRTT